MRQNILAIGEILWDLLPSGRQLGGAPANFACHARALGAEARLITRLGDDPLGREILERLEVLGLTTDTIQVDPEAPTGTVDIELGADGQPRFTIVADVAWDRIEADRLALAAAEEADAVAFGSLAQRSEVSRRAVREVVLATRPGAARIFDVNLRPPFIDQDVIERSLELATVVKLNDQELPLLGEMLELPGTVERQMASLALRYGLTLVALTRGSRGSLLLRDGEWSDHPGFPAVVSDTVGAGDAFAAVLAVGMLRSWPLDRLNDRANRVAAYICTQPGAIPPLPAGLLDP